MLCAIEKRWRVRRTKVPEKVRYLILSYLKHQESLTIAGADKAAATVRRAAPQKTTELKAKDTAEALRSNPKDVRIIHSGLENNGQVLAGYLGLSDTNALREFMANTQVLENLTPWIESRRKNFGCDLQTKNPNWARDKIFRYIYEPDSISIQDLEQGLPLDETRWPSTSMSRGHVSWVVTMFRLIAQSDEKTFPSSYQLDTETLEQYLGACHPEDYHRAYCLLRFYWRENSESRRAKSTESHKQNLTAKIPEYLKDEDYRSVKDEEGNLLTTVNPALDEYLEQEEDVKSEEDTMSEDLNYSDMQKVELLEGLETTLNDAFQKTPSRLPQLRLPELTTDVQMAVLANIGKKVKVIWPAINDKPTQPAPSTVATASEEIKRVALEASITTDTPMTEEARRNFWSLQRSLNQVSSRPPDYGACANILELYHRNTMVEKTNLLPQQVSGAAWLLLMLASPYHFALLSDDVGLGKTTTALALLSIRSKFAAHQQLQKGELE